MKGARYEDKVINGIVIMSTINVVNIIHSTIPFDAILLAVNLAVLFFVFSHCCKILPALFCEVWSPSRT